MPAKKSGSRKSKVEKVMHEYKEGDLKSGGSGRKVKSRKQAIAIALSEAREAGEKVPAKKTARKKTAAKKAAPKKKSTAKKAAPKKKTAAKKSAAPKKSSAKKSGRRKTAARKK